MALGAGQERDDVGDVLRDLRPSDLRQSLRDRSVDLVLASISGTLGEALDRADLRPSRMDVHVPADHRLAEAGSASLEDFDGERLLTASPAGTPDTDLLVEPAGRPPQAVTELRAQLGA